uniref:Uncharacterized protein n=1 Tax=Globodera rostochiensis TaxID=31243 RepID=A0A914I680_GLORO
MKILQKFQKSQIRDTEERTNRKWHWKRCQFDELLTTISTNIDIVIQTIVLQDAFFKFSLALLRAADHEQFQLTMALLLDKYSPILRSALTDIWVLLADSADSIFGALQNFFILFRELQSAVEFSSYSDRVFVDSTSVVTVCIDFLQTATMAQQSKEVNKVAQLLSCLIVILISGNAIKLRILHENFQRMLGAGSDPNVHLVLLRNLFHDCSIQISVTFYNLTHRQSLHILGSGVGGSSRNSEKSLRDTTEDDENSSSDLMETAEQNEAKRRHIPPTTIPGTILRMPASLGMLQLFSLERLKFLCVSLETLNDELEHGLRSVSTFFRPFKFWRSARLKKLIATIFTIISTLRQPLKASQLTIKSMLNIAEQLVILYPQPKFLLEFFRLSLTDSLMSQTICQSLRSMMEQCPFQPGEVLLFPQKENLIMSSLDPTECAIGGPATAAPVPSLEPMAAVFELDSSYNSSGLTVSCWVRKTAKNSSSWLHIISLGNRHVRISAELANIDSARISISRLDSTGSSFLFQDFVFKKVFHDNDLFVNIAIGLRIYDKQFKAMFAVGNNLKSLEAPLFSADLIKNFARKGVAIAFGSKSCNEFDQNNMTDVIYELTTIFGFRGLIPTDLVVLLQAAGPASKLFHRLCQRILRTLFSSREDTLLFFKSFCFSRFGQPLHIESQSVPIDWKTEIVHNYTATLDKSFRTIGGVKLFLFLYALTVERAYPPATQLEALRLLFLVLRRDPAYYDEWKCQEGDDNSKRSPIEFARSGPSLLVRCLASRAAHMDEHIFQELVWFIFSNIVRNDQAKIVLSDRTVIQEPEFLQALISCTDIWKGKCFILWIQMTKFVAKCISSSSMIFADDEDNGDRKEGDNLPQKFRQFNLSQLQRVDFLRDFFFSLLDMLTNCHQFQIPSSLCSIGRKKSSSASTVSRKQSTMQSAELAEDISRIVHHLVGGFASNYNSQKIGELCDGRNAWINDDFGQPILSNPEQLVRSDYKSELSDHLDKLLKKRGRDFIGRLWTELNGSAVAMRNRLYNDENCNKVATKNKSNVEQGLPRRSECDYRETCAVQNLKLSLEAQKSEDISKAEEFSDDIAMCAKHQQIGPKEHWLVHVRVRLLRLLCEVILNSDDSTIATLEVNVLNWQTLLVLLSKQRFQQLRSFTFTLLKNIFLRSSRTFRQSFIDRQGFLLLGRELRGAPMNFSIANAIFSMTCGEHVLLKNGLDTAHLEKLVFDPFKIGSFSALFTLLEESVVHPTLFWSVCSTLQKIFITDSAPRQSMLQLGLVESMANVLRRLCCSSANTQRVCQTDGKTMDVEMFSLFDCWLSFARSILISLVPYDDPCSYSSCEEFVWLCFIALWKDGGRLTGKFRRKTTSSNRARSTSSGSSTDQSEHSSEVGLSSAPSSGNPLLRQAFFFRVWRLPFGDRSCNGIDENASQWLPADSSFGDIIRPHGPHSFASVFSPGFASNEENANRLLFSLGMIRNLFLFFDAPQSATDSEETLLTTFLDILLSACCLSPRKAINKLDDWQTILQSASFLRRARYFLSQHSSSSQTLFDLSSEGGTVDAELGQTAAHCSFASDSLPWPLRRRLIVVHFLAKELRQNRESVTMLMEINLDFQYALKIGLHELCLLPFASSLHCEAISEYDVDLDLLIKFMHSIQIRSPLANLTIEEINSLTADEMLLLQQFDEIKGQFCGQMTERAKAIWDRECDLLKFISDQAITLTCEVAEYQNVPRRLLINWKRELQREWSRANRTLAHFVKELCHPEAPFFAPLSWPLGRVLNTTEGPSRERRRFSAAHYSFPLKFLKAERCKAVESVHNALMPLDNLLNGGEPQQSHAYEHTEVDGPIRMSFSATILRTAFDCSGELAVSDLKLYFLGESAKTTQKGVVHAPVTYSWDYDQIREVHIRFYQLKDTALELFTSTGDAFLVVFASEKDRSVLLQQFRTLRLEKLLVDHKTQLRSATQMWRRGTLTNFDYLMTLNKLAGRTFNDLMQYPIFPFVLSDYTSDTFDLTNPSSYRTLAKPMAIQDSRMEKVYAQNYQSLAEEYGRFNRSGDFGSSSNKTFSSVRFGPYHYGSHYSNTGIVAHYLVRIPPYTSVALEYQDNNFDIPDRLFGSMDTTWRLSSSESTTDFKELIPEFFYLYEMFRNSDELELGVRQSGDRVDHVQVPPWCPRADQRLFCLIHRHALENHYVTANLHHWIDLIFGFKQSGENAVRAMNVFHPATYRGRDLEENSKGDPLIVCAIQTMVRTYATPKAHGTSSSMPVGPFHEQFHTVVGVRWGDFVGSPEHDGFYFSTPSRFFTPATKRALRLTLVHCDPTTEICYGLPKSTELIAYYRSDRKDPLRRDNELALCAIVSWDRPSNFIDNILRIKLIFAGQPHKKHFQLSPTTTDVPQQCWERLIDLQSLQLCRVAYSSAANSLLLGFKCGLIRVYSLHYDQADDRDELSRKKWHCRLRSSLYAHSCAISSLSISDRFHVILSASIDAKICLWDANKHNFERRFQLPPPVFSGSVPIEETVTLSCVSSTNADVGVVFQSGLAGSRELQGTITSIAMTDLAEGTAVNCVAIGLQSGVIRLIEMWTMTVVRDISFQSFQTDIISLLFANGSRRLYAAFANSQVLCWQVPSITGAESGATATAGKEQPCFKMA